MASANIVTVTDSNFDAQVLNATGLVVLDFWAEWCGPCKMIAPILDELAGDYAGRITIGKLNIDEFQGIAGRFGITSIPTLLFFKGGQVVDQVVGMRSKKDFKAKIDQQIG